MTIYIYILHVWHQLPFLHLQGVSTWMTNHFILSLIPPKPRRERPSCWVYMCFFFCFFFKIQPFTLLINNSLVNISTHVKSFGVIFDSLLSFGFHINNISHSAFFHCVTMADFAHHFLSIALKFLFMPWSRHGSTIVILFYLVFLINGFID